MQTNIAMPAGVKNYGSYDLSAALKSDRAVSFKELLKRNMAGERLEYRYYNVDLAADNGVDTNITIFHDVFPIDIPCEEALNYIKDWYRIHEQKEPLKITYRTCRGFERDGTGVSGGFNVHVAEIWWDDYWKYGAAMELGQKLAQKRNEALCSLDCACL